MHIIIDGYNVLKQVIADQEITESQRRAFINMLGKYAERKNHTITIIFDGGPDVWPSQHKDHGILVIYSGFKQSADDLIKKVVAQRPQVLVTSDNGLKAAAKSAMAMDSLEFYRVVKQECIPKEKTVDHTLLKTSSEQNSLVDELMRTDHQSIYKEGQEEASPRKPKGHTLSKKERAYLQKLKKL